MDSDPDTISKQSLIPKRETTPAPSTDTNPIEPSSFTEKDNNAKEQFQQQQLEVVPRNQIQICVLY